MTNSYYSDEEVDYYHDRLQFYADQVASREITLAQVPRQLLLDSMFFDRVFFLVTGNRDGVDLYLKSVTVQRLLDTGKEDLMTHHCQDVVSDSNLDSVK